jgi:hypothetical protein
MMGLSQYPKQKVSAEDGKEKMQYVNPHRAQTLVQELKEGFQSMRLM